MDSIAKQPVDSPKGRIWMDSLPRPAAREAAGALAVLPADAAAAGDGLPLAIAAWSLAEPEVAAGLLEAWLATADGEGNLSPSCPVGCQWAEQVADALPDSEKFLLRILPRLAKYAERQFDRYDARGTGLPRWPSAEEALFPPEFAPGRFTVDLAVLLSNEAAAFCRLAKGHPEFDRVIGVAEGEQRELDDWLMENFWDEEASAFHRLDEGAESVPDFSPCGFFPLAWEGRTEAMVEGLRPRMAQGDLSVWPARARILFFALLLRTPHNSILARMRRTRLPADASPVEKAAWAVLAAGADGARAPFLNGIPRSARWLDAHGRGIACTLWACGVALVLALLGWWIFQRENPYPGNAAELERRARLACAEGRHDRAAALYGQAARRENGAYFRYRQAGEWLHLEHFAAAEKAYRALLAREPDTPNARFNLALSVLRQGRREEARALYRAVAEEAGATAHPELAARAKLAAELIERQLALDRAAP
jgi:tetratricopeptide (TPR) repeat protein